MATDRKHTTLDEVVRELLIEEGMNTTHNYLRYLTIANRGLKELTYDVLGSTKVMLLTVGNTMRIDLPVDFTDYSFVGIIASDGRVHTMGNRKNIPLVGTQNTVAQQSDDYAFYYGGVFGYGGGQNEHGYYSPKIDYDNWQMVFSSTEVGKVIYLEYISDGRAEGGETVIHPYAVEALIAWTYWKSIVRRRRGVTTNDKEEARRTYYNEKRLARARVCGFTKEESLQQIRKGYKQSPKF